jgi:hypothetical protein
MKDFLELLDQDGKLEPGVRQGYRTVKNFEEKMVRFLELIGNKPGYSKHKREYLMKEAEGTSDFPILFGTVLERSLIAAYSIQLPEWKTYTKTGTQNDFRAANLIGMFGLQSNLPQVKERGEYKADKLFDGKVSNTLLKYGRRFPLSWEALINDDLGAFSDVATRLANAARRTEAYQATKLFVASTGPHASLFGSPITHPLDGASVTNKGVLSFSADNLSATIALMRSQKDVDGEPIIFDGFELVFGPKLQIRVLQALNPASLIATGIPTVTAATGTSANIASMLNITPHMNPYLPIVDASANNDYTWYVFARLSNGAAIQMNYLKGHENPEVVQKLSDKMAVGGGAVSPMEGDFANDTMNWRIRHILGGTQIDPRLAYAQVSNS